MDKYCGNCGHPLSDGEKFCGNCGQPVNTVKEKQSIAAESKKEPVKESANENPQKGAVKQKEGGFFSKLIEEVKDLIRHPKKLLPTIVLSVFWMVFPMLSAFGANIPI